jgi:hypothetical protein
MNSANKGAIAGAHRNGKPMVAVTTVAAPFVAQWVLL